MLHLIKDTEGSKWDARPVTLETQTIFWGVKSFESKSKSWWNLWYSEGNLYPKGTVRNFDLRSLYKGEQKPITDLSRSEKRLGLLGAKSRDLMQAPLDSVEYSCTRGTMKWNQARQAGNFGWPYSGGNNYAVSWNLEFASRYCHGASLLTPGNNQ